MNNCVGKTNTDGSAAPPDPSSYFAGSDPVLVYSYQTCAADNTFIGTVHDPVACGVASDCGASDPRAT